MLKKHILHFSSLIILLQFLYSTNLLSQNTNEKLKEVVYYYPNGQKSSEGTLKNGKPEGYWKNYYEWGIIKSEGNRVDHQLEGEWKFYNKTGDLEKIIDYKGDRKDGFIKTYSDSCNLVLQEPIIQDVKHGEEIEYFDEPGEIIKLITPYKEGQKDGLSKEFNKFGTIITLINYRHGFIKNKEQINRSDKKGKQGNWKEFYNNGRLSRSMRYKDDVLNGYYKEYSKDGILEVAILYVDGVAQKEEDLLKKLETRRTYYADGQVKNEGSYNLEGLKQGVHLTFNEKGDIELGEIYNSDTLVGKGNFNSDGQRIGDWEEYYSSGRIKGKGKYKNGVKVGDWIYYYENGKVEQEGKYTKNGEPNGKWVWYYDNGNILREENYYKGLEDGEFTELNRTGEVITKGTYLEGKKDGYWFYELGDYREEGNYREGRKEGTWKHYYENGKLLFTGLFIDGNPEGIHRYYYENGALRREEKYSVGLPDGIWRSYSDDGEVFLTTVYRDGKEYKLDNRKLAD